MLELYNDKLIDLFAKPGGDGDVSFFYLFILHSIFPVSYCSIWYFWIAIFGFLEHLLSLVGIFYLVLKPTLQIHTS